MFGNSAKALFAISAVGLLVVGTLLFRPDYFSSSSGLTMLIGAVLLLAVIANYRKIFFPVILICFLLAGTGLPLQRAFLQGRWIVLATGAVIGLAIYLKTFPHTFGRFHLVALFCVLSAFVSALVSEYPNESLLKTLSLFLLFLYVAAGARTAVPMRAERFFIRLVAAVEILLWVSMFYYLVLRNEVFGNPNSLGAVMAIVVVPVLLWGFLTSQARSRRLRLGAELTMAILLLLSSFARAAIGAAAVSCILVCLSARQYRQLAKGLAIASVLGIGVMLFAPQHPDESSMQGSKSMTNAFLYKGKREQGVLGSRRGVWQQTWDVIREKPWFGSGFGTSAITEDMTKLEYAAHHIDTWVVREHGNSYLAIAEWTGILGVLPFYLIVALVGLNARTAFSYVLRTRDVFSPALVAAAIVTAGLVDALFEDWLFAVGYYVCVFFWAVAFILVDVLPRQSGVHSAEPVVSWSSQAYAAVAPSQ